MGLRKQERKKKDAIKKWLNDMLWDDDIKNLEKTLKTLKEG